MFAQFRVTYPTGQLISELIAIHNGKFVVRALVQVDGMTVATGLAAADTVELAEDAARLRSLALLGLNASTPTLETVPVSPVAVPEVPVSTDRLATSPQSSFINPQPLPTPLAYTPEPVKHAYSPPIASVPPEPQQFDSDAWLGSSYREPAMDPPTLSSSLETSPALSGTRLSGAELSEPTDDSEVIAQIDVLLKRLKWTKDQEAEYLVQNYGKRSQSLLSGEELRDFLDYLEIFGKTTEQIKRIGWGTKQGREYLELTYSKISRHHLNKQELIEFLQYLETQ